MQKANMAKVGNGRELEELARAVKVERDRFGGRVKRWPRAIIEEAYRLSEIGLKVKDIAERCGLCPQSINKWQRVMWSKIRHGSAETGFMELGIVSKTPRSRVTKHSRQSIRSSNQVEGNLTIEGTRGHKIIGLRLLDAA